LPQPDTDVVGLLRDLGYERREQPFQLASGEWSQDYIDAKRALSEGDNLRRVAEAVLSVASEAGVEFDAVGGLTMGADPTSHAVALLAGKKWFSVRKQPKGHGRQQLIEGAELGPGMRVLLVDDVVTTGSSILEALEAALARGAEVVLAVALVDRGKTASAKLASRGIKYVPLATYRDFEIVPVPGHA
jgi:orotate phosphoribosyltransferase